jgi:hypothetical protein
MQSYKRNYVFNMQQRELDNLSIKVELPVIDGGMYKCSDIDDLFLISEHYDPYRTLDIKTELISRIRGKTRNIATRSTLSGAGAGGGPCNRGHFGVTMFKNHCLLDCFICSLTGSREFISAWTTDESGFDSRQGQEIANIFSLVSIPALGSRDCFPTSKATETCS